jgi:hypothetical protein
MYYIKKIKNKISSLTDVYQRSALGIRITKEQMRVNQLDKDMFKDIHGL